MVGSGQWGGDGHVPVVDRGHRDAGLKQLIAFARFELLLAARPEASAVNVNRQGRGCIAVGEPDVEDVPLVVAVLHVGMCGRSLSFGLCRTGAGSLSALPLCPGGSQPYDSLLLHSRKHAVSVCVGSRETLQDHLVQSRFLRLG